MFKKFFRFNKLFLLASLGTLIFCFNSPQNDDEKMETIMISVNNVLKYLSFSPKPMDAAYSQDVYKMYLDNIDPMKRYFLQSDLNEFAKSKDSLAIYLQNGNISFYKNTIDRLYQRIDQIDKITQDVLSKPINLNTDDQYVLDPKVKKNPANQQELYNDWSRFIKYNILQEMQSQIDKEEAQKKKKDSVIAAKGVDTIKYQPTTLAQKQTKAISEVKDLISDTFRRFKKRKKSVWFTSYMNAYTMVFDPHSNYFSPDEKADFDVSFSGSITGIGAQVQEKKGRIFVGPLVVGAPAWKSKQIQEGDEILKVKPSPKDEAVNVSGMLIDEAVKLIRGPKGVPVTLTLKKKDGTVKDVTIVRDEVQIEDTFAKSIVVDTPNGGKYGYIYLPSFNADFNDPKGHRASVDVKNEILKLKKENVQGIILDLRNNGGGSLTEVVDMMGLLMKGGPVVQVKSGDGKIQVLKEHSTDPIWTGPFVLMQNELSASASEIMAGAVKDYRRGIIVGAPHSYGKGTVQTFVPLNRFLKSKTDYGDVKLTIQKFYRVSGKSTQLKGVQSDVVMDDYYTHDDIGEKYSDYALPWDQIASAQYTPFDNINFPAIVDQAQKRIDANATYQLLLESAKWQQQLDKLETITLNQTKFFALMRERKAQLKKFDPLTKYNNGLQFILHPDEVARMKTDEAFRVGRQNWVKQLKRDLYLQEAVQVLGDEKKYY